jgi:AbiV family abortive infection protein
MTQAEQTQPSLGFLRPYRGPLTDEQIAHGMNLAEANAKALVADADALFKADRVGRGFALAVLAIEEAGKVHLLRGLGAAETDAMRRHIWNRLRKHTSKSLMWPFPEAVHHAWRHDLEIKLSNLISLVERDDAPHALALDSLKQRALYVDVTHDGSQWTEPATTVNKERAYRIMTAAIQLTQGSFQHTAREIALFREHMRPVMQKPAEDRLAAIQAWIRAMISEGLAPEHPLVDKFFTGFRRTQVDALQHPSASSSSSAKGTD